MSQKFLRSLWEMNPHLRQRVTKAKKEGKNLKRVNTHIKGEVHPHLRILDLLASPEENVLILNLNMTQKLIATSTKTCRSS